MKEILKQVPAHWSITLKVTDRKAKAAKQKNVVYEFIGELQADSSSENILRAIRTAQHCIDRWGQK